mgnify:CR=1 FL=1
MKKNGFTLVEIIVVITILAIITVIIVPKINNTINNDKRKVCNSIEETAIDAANSYVYMHTNTVNSSIISNGYFDVTLLTLMEEGLITTTLENPYDNTAISTSNVVRITKSGNIYSFNYMGEDCE